MGTRTFPCGSCGETDWEIIGPGPLPRAVWRWLREGRRGLAKQLECRRCGSTTSSAATAMLSARRGRGRVARVLQSLSWARSARPVPMTYLLGFAVGGAFGAVLQAWRGWTWWLIALGTLTAVWLVFASSIFWGSDRPRRHAAGAIVNAFAPTRGEARERQRRDDLFRRVTFPLFGLPPSYTGPRWVGGWGGTDNVTTSAVLAHGEPFRECVRVEMGRGGNHSDGWILEHELAHHAAIERLGQGADMGALIRVRREIEMERAGRAWERVTIDVDGAGIPFRYSAEGSFWVATGSVGDMRIVLHGEGFPIREVSLVRVGVEPYIEGSRQQEAENDARRRRKRGG